MNKSIVWNMAVLLTLMGCAEARIHGSSDVPWAAVETSALQFLLPPIKISSTSEPRAIAVTASGAVVYTADDGAVYQITPDRSVKTMATGLSLPEGIAVDSSGNIYVADTGNHRVLKISSESAMTVLAGNGAVGKVDGPGPQATFSSPRGICLDSAGRVVVVDSGNKAIRRIDTNGTVTTIQNVNVLTYPWVAADKSGSVFFIDNTTITKLSSNLDRSNVMVHRNSPLNGLCTDSSGNIFFSSRDQLYRVTPRGEAQHVAGSHRTGYKDQLGKNAEFNGPTGMASDTAGNIYLSDSKNKSIRFMTTAWNVFTFASGR